MSNRLRMKRHGSFTAICPLRTDGGASEDLAKLLASLDDAVQAHANGQQVEPPFLPFWEMSGVHYARFVIIDDENVRGPRGERLPPCLLYSAQHDGTEDDHLAQLTGAGEQVLLRICGHCERFDAEAGPPRVRLRRYLRTHSLAPGAFYVGAIGRTVGRIGWEAEVAGWIRAKAADLYDERPGIEPCEAWRRIRDHVRERLRGPEGQALEAKHGREAVESANWGRYKRGTYWLWNLVWTAAYLLPVALLALVVWVPSLLLLPIAALLLALWLRELEQQDEEVLRREASNVSDAARSARQAERDRKLALREDRWPQNELTVVSVVKPSLLRRRLLPGILWVIQQRARFKFTRGLLHGVPTIHFAHWTIFDGGRRLVFASNYDGSFPSYLDDFIQHAPKALNAIWSHVRGFPATRFMLWAGATDGPAFKAWGRRDQVQARVWYSAYPLLSLEEINRNTELVEGLEDEGLGDPVERARTLDWLGERPEKLWDEA